jgi:hypothetical protein
VEVDHRRIVAEAVKAVVIVMAGMGEPQAVEDPVMWPGCMVPLH